jgi:hypothetical protein
MNLKRSVSMTKTFFIFLTGFACLLAACKTVHPYQRTYLNDYEMQLSKNAGAKFEDYVHVVREGGTVPGGVKSSGGCGCN